MKAVGMLTIAALAVAACGLDEGRPPVARIQIDPAAIPEHDNFATSVTLDGTASDDPIDDPDGLGALDLSWEIVGDEYHLEPGSQLDEEMVMLRFRGDTPATIRLTVTDQDGLSNVAERQVTLSVAR